MKLKQGNLGQGMTEYIIIVGIIAVSAIGITSIMSNHVKVGFGTIANALRGNDDRPMDFQEITETNMKGKDMGNFHDTADR